MEIQAVGCVVQKGQTKVVHVLNTYMNRTVDDRHCLKHMEKAEASLKVNGDAQSDALYSDHQSVARYEAFEKFMEEEEDAGL